MQQRLPLIVLGGSDRKPAQMPDEGSSQHPLTGYKGLDIRIDGRSVRTTRIEDSEGLIPPVNEMYVGPDGRLVKIVAGNLEMIATSKEKIKAMYGDRAAEVERTLRQLAAAQRRADSGRGGVRPRSPRRPGSGTGRAKP